MAKDHGPSVKDDKQYEGLRKKTADMLDTNVGADDKDAPADVARDGFEAMMAGKERVVSASLTTKVMGRAGRFVPDSVKAEQHREMAEPGSARTL
jgi:hypothetical protein